jgi:hypothetical protein
VTNWCNGAEENHPGGDRLGNCHGVEGNQRSTLRRTGPAVGDGTHGAEGVEVGVISPGATAGNWKKNIEVMAVCRPPQTMAAAEVPKWALSARAHRR